MNCVTFFSIFEEGNFLLMLAKISVVCFILGAFFTSVRADSIPDSTLATNYLEKGDEILPVSMDSAIFYYNKAKVLFHTLGNKELKSNCFLLIESAYAYHDRIDSLTTFALQVVDSIENILGPKHYKYFLAIQNTAAIYNMEGRYFESIRQHKEFINKIAYLSDSIKNSSSFLNIIIYNLRGLAVSNSFLGDYEEAIRYIKQVQSLRKRSGEIISKPVAVEHSILASIFIDQFHYREALEELRKCLMILDRLDLNSVSRDYIDAYYKMATCFIKLNVPDSALYALNESDPLQEIGSGRRPQIGEIKRGDIAVLKGAYDDAFKYYQKGLDLWEKVFGGRKKHLVFVRLYGEIGLTYTKIQDYPSALQHYQLALSSGHSTMTGDEPVDYFPPITELPNPVLCIPILDKKAQAILKRADGTLVDRQLAQACYLRVDSLASRSLRELRSAESRAFFSEEFRPIYERAIDNCYMLYQQTGNIAYLTQAFAYSERSKAILLSLALRDSKAKIEGGLPSEVLEKEYQLRTDIAAYRKRIFGAKASTDSLVLDSWRNKLFEMEEDFRKLVASMETDYPNYYQVKYGVMTVTPAQVQASLRGKDHQLIAYFLGDSALYRFVFSKGNVAMHKQENWAEGQSHFERLLPLLQTPSLESLAPFKEHAYGLYQALLPYPSNDAPQQLTIIPDGQLGFLPFGVLLSKQAAPSDGFRDLPYVCQRTQINYGYSATLLGTSFTQKTAFDKKLSAFAPAYEAELRLSTNQPQAKAVVEQVGGHAFLASAATEAAFKQTAQTSRILHLAMHGVPDVEQSLYAHMLFGPSTDSVEDGKLHAYELYNLSLNTQLVTLSACETGYGKLAQGEGVMSLARAFRYSGCQSILFSHWKVDGRAANELLAGFYEAIGEGKRPSAAIWQAQKDFLAAAPPDQVHPFYWANFVLTGEDHPLSSPFSKWWWGGGIFLVVLMMAFLWRRWS